VNIHIINNNKINKLINGVKFCRHSFVFDLIFVSPPDHMLPSVKKNKNLRIRFKIRLNDNGVWVCPQHWTVTELFPSTTEDILLPQSDHGGLRAKFPTWTDSRPTSGMRVRLTEFNYTSWNRCNYCSPKWTSIEVNAQARRQEMKWVVFCNKNGK